MDHRVERVVLETDRYRIVGDVTLPNDGYKSRFSDLLNRSDVEFISLTDVEIHGYDDGDNLRRSFVAVGRGAVRLAYPAEAS